MAYDNKREDKVYLSLGSNLGDRKKNILNAVKQLEETLNQKVIISPFYESKAKGFDSKKDFLNICAQTQTQIEPHEFLKIIHSIEHKLGRIRVENSGYIDRIIDIDILFYGQRIIDTKNLKVPHPKIYERKFVLIPLRDVAKNLVDPRTRMNIRRLIEDCNDKSNLLLCEN
ncbi:MAG: 2-amino-4-hydroxy-6-hydroxymethyldihydropteridine diphosphokinase [Fluviicola sp.]|nr:MAG: 2-amino-4-hydroxy-6-hydroxymethyldihydropteridine diphosphokinase [Fluviicola sp.]